MEIITWPRNVVQIMKAEPKDVTHFIGRGS